MLTGVPGHPFTACYSCAKGLPAAHAAATAAHAAGAGFGAAGDGHIRAAVNGVVGGVQIKAAAADRQATGGYGARVVLDGDGYGLGMSIARGIVIAHRGKIQATSPKENTLMVLVSLPLPR